MKKILKTFVNYLILKFPNFSQRFSRFIGGKCQMNINIDLLNPNQKKVLFCYLYLEDVDLTKASHANYQHASLMLKCLIDMGYCVDVCNCFDEMSYERLKEKKYDMIIGQGIVFKKFCSNQSIQQKILFVSENNPTVVIDKYNKRIESFKRRHPGVDLSKSIARIGGYLDEEMFDLADFAIVMNSDYNTKSMLPFFIDVFTINCNALYNANYRFLKKMLEPTIEQTKSNFLWFGSTGLIHKGVDLLVDAFREMPKFSIDFYGLCDSERELFNKIKAGNTVDCGRVNVQEPEFIEKIVNKHCFIIFPSCSEGMSTAVATCMAHGIIPILTKECGFNPCEYIIELEGWQVEDIKNAVKQVVSMSNEEIISLRENCYKYAQENFSLEHFNRSFREIMKSISDKVVIKSAL